MLYAQRMVLTFAIIKCFDGLFHSLLYGKLQITFIQMWEHATDSPPKASLWQLSQQQSPKAAAGLQAETTAVTASRGSFLSQAFPLVYGARLGETGHGLKKERFRLCIRKPFFTWWTLIFRSRLVLRKVLQPPSLVISKPQWTQNHKQPARILHLILLGAGDWATDLLCFLLPEPSCALMNAFSCPGLALLSKVVDLPSCYH